MIGLAVAESDANILYIGTRSSLKYIVSGRRYIECAHRTPMRITVYAGTQSRQSGHIKVNYEDTE